MNSPSIFAPFRTSADWTRFTCIEKGRLLYTTLIRRTIPSRNTLTDATSMKLNRTSKCPVAQSRWHTKLAIVPQMETRGVYSHHTQWQSEYLPRGLLVGVWNCPGEEELTYSIISICWPETGSDCSLASPTWKEKSRHPWRIYAFLSAWCVQDRSQCSTCF